MNITYCLTTTGVDAYSTSTLISALSVRRMHPTARIVVVTDEQSANALRACQHALLKTTDELIAIPVPAGSPAMRNRFVKTQQRRLVAGDFLYLDADTVVVAPLDEIFGFAAPLAAAPNHNSPRPIDASFADELSACRANRWQVGESTYVNSGVIFFRDTPECRTFGELWHRKWREASAGGRHFDQPSFNSALWDSGIACQVLPHRFNAQVQVRPRTAIGAALWHIYASLNAELSPKNELDALIERGLANDGIITPDDIEALCRRLHPWTIGNPVDALVVRSMLKRWDYLPAEAFERKWLAGCKRRACANLVKPIVRPLFPRRRAA